MTPAARPRRLMQLEKLRLVQEAATDRANSILERLAPDPALEQKPKNG